MTARIRHLPARSKAGWTLPAWTALLGLLLVVDAAPAGAQLQIESRIEAVVHENLKYPRDDEHTNGGRP